MFNLLQKLGDTYTWPVTLRAPVDGGKVVEIKFIAKFNRLPVERVREINRGADEMPEGEKPVTVPEAVQEVLVDILYIADDKTTQTASDDEKERLLAVTGADVAIWSGFRASLSGEKAKN